MAKPEGFKCYSLRHCVRFSLARICRRLAKSRGRWPVLASLVSRHRVGPGVAAGTVMLPIEDLKKPLYYLGIFSFVHCLTMWIVSFFISRLPLWRSRRACSEESPHKVKREVVGFITPKFLPWIHS